MKAITKKLRTKTDQHFDRDLKSAVEAFEKNHQFITASIYMGRGMRQHYLSRFIGPDIPFTIRRKKMKLKLEINSEVYRVYEDEKLPENNIRIKADHTKKEIQQANKLVLLANEELEYRKNLKPYESLSFRELEVTTDNLEYYLCNPRRGVSRMALPSALGALKALIRFTQSKSTFHQDWEILHFRLTEILVNYPKYFNQHNQ